MYSGQWNGVYDQQIRDFHIGSMGYDMVRLVLLSDGTTSDAVASTVLTLMSLLAYQNSFIGSGTGDNNDTIVACDNAIQMESKAGCWAAKSVFTEVWCGMQLPGE